MIPVSVCLPTFNGEAFLRSALDSVLAQTFRDFELVISDDSSTDSTWQILQHYAQRDERIKLSRNEKPLGLFGNYNKCLELAGGELIKPFAQDDLLAPTMLERTVKVMRDHKDVVLTSTMRASINETGKVQDAKVTGIPQGSEKFGASDELPGLEVIRRCIMPLVNYIGEPSAVMFRASAIGTGFDTTFHHIGDIEYWLRILTEGNYLFIQSPLCSFRKHNGSQSSANARQLVAGADLVTFSHKFSWVLEAAGTSGCEFISHNVEAFADHVAFHMSDPAESILQMRQGSNDPHIAALREIAYHSLYKLGQIRLGQRMNAEYVDKLASNQRTINMLEQDLKVLLQSPSWISTKVLRDVNALLGSRDESDTFTQPESSSQSADASELQQKYIKHLRKSIAVVTASRSWRMTKPLRDFERKNRSSLKYKHRQH